MVMSKSSFLTVATFILSTLYSPVISENTDFYNILALDGGGIRGLITAQVVEYMENYTYEYARKHYCIDERTPEKVSMAELFDMVSGTSTGSLLSTAIVMPNNDPAINRTNMYFANDASEIYKKHGKDVFLKFSLPFWVRLLGTLAFILFGGMIGYCIGVCVYRNRGHEKTMQLFNKLLKERK